MVGKMTWAAPDLRNSLLVVIIVLGHNLHVVSHEVHRVEANTELADQVDIAALLHVLQKGCTEETWGWDTS